MHKMQIYVATPYTHANPDVVAQRYDAAMDFVAWLLNNSPTVVPFSPILYCHPMAKVHKLPTDADYWWDFNRTIIDRSEGVYLLKMEGWELSYGIKKELEYCKRQSIHVQNWVPISPTNYQVE